MKFQYLFIPKNINLHHCPESYGTALSANNIDNSSLIEYIPKLDYKFYHKLISLFKNKNYQNTYSFFFFSVQVEYFILVVFLRILSAFSSTKLDIYYLMHEPKHKAGESQNSSIKLFLLFFYNYFFAQASNKVILPSNQAVAKSENFVDHQKVYQVNLSFLQNSNELLEKSIKQLRGSWDDCKTFSFICTAVKDKNPQGFVSFVNAFSDYHKSKSRFIRAGKDLRVSVNYNEDSIIRFPGYISNSSKEFLLNLTHFLVIPYNLSTQSGAIAEALSYGKFLIVNNIPAFAYLKELKFAFVIDFNNEEEILDCIQQIFSMDIQYYEECFWEAINYFNEYHSEIYLSQELNQIL
jgi:hypothetical protein